jgi:tetrahydromethanopterin S-methyltransferase subunit G
MGINLAVLIGLAIKRKTGVVAGIVAGLLATPVLVVAFFAFVILPAMRFY